MVPAWILFDMDVVMGVSARVGLACEMDGSWDRKR